MVPLDVAAMFPNIPLEFIKKSVSYRLNKMKSFTKLDEKKFLKGLRLGIGGKCLYYNISGNAWKGSRKIVFSFLLAYVVEW